jgi:hypothetical protein
MFDLKPISATSIEGALAKVERYRLLNEPAQAESICRDILLVDSTNQSALSSIILALTDQITDDNGAFARALTFVPRLENPYDRAYYAGIAWERRANAAHGVLGSRHYVYEWITQALRLFEEAEKLRTPGNDDSILRWNTCVRFLARHKELAPAAETTPEPILSE